MIPENIDGEINRLRQAMLKKLRDLSLDTYRTESLQIVHQLSQWDVLKNARVVAAFYPMRSEAQIQPLLQGLAQTRTLLLPRVLPQAQLEFVEVQNILSDLRAATFGLMEPHLHAKAWEGPPPDIILVPGILFGGHGERIGHGGGYFDRFLPTIPHALRVGVALNCQFEEKGFVQRPHDVRMSYIVTPNGIVAAGT